MVLSLELDMLDGLSLLPEEEALGLLEPELVLLGLLALLDPEPDPYVWPLPVSPWEEPLMPLLLEPGDELPMVLALDPDETEDEPPTFSAASVWPSIWPEAEMPCCCWNFFSAALVLGPAMPSTGPALKPLSFRACCTWVTFELSFEDDGALPMLLEEAADWSLALEDD